MNIKYALRGRNEMANNGLMAHVTQEVVNNFRISPPSTKENHLLQEENQFIFSYFRCGMCLCET